MEDDYESLSPSDQSSPQVQRRKLKRLKKREGAVQSSPVYYGLSPKSTEEDDLLSFPRVDFAQLLALEAALEDSNSDDSNQPLLLSQSQEYGSAERRGVKAKDSSDELDDEIRGEDRVDARRALEFDDVADSENLGTNQLAEEDKIVEKKINKRVKNDGAKGSKPGKRKLEKERKNYLTQLHAESQRLLRETTNAAFKHTPVVGKSISDVLEKIRERKMLVTKNTTTMMPYNNVSASSNIMSSLRDDIEVKERESNGVVKSVDQLPHMTAEKDEISSKGHQLNADCLELDGSTKSATPSGCENRPIQKDPDEESIPPIFRAPIGGRQGILEDSDTKENEVESQSDHADIPFEEAFVPSPPASIIRFDQDLSDYSSSEEGNDKENVPPLSQRSEDSSLRGDPVKAFLDEEAEEEDDSDHDMLRFPENEDDMGDSEELNDIIATDYEERPVDNERRNELHQKWLERQDAAGTDNLLQKLKFGVHQQETAAICQEEEYDDKEEYSAEDEDDPPPKCATRVNMRKARQMITEMFDEKDEIFLSDEDEESEKIFFKHRHIVRTEEQEVSVSSVQDESSKEVFGLIKKLNIGPVSRKKARVSSYFDSMLKVENGNSFSKSSFAGRFSNHPLPSCHRKSSGSARSFIFGRDDSNSQNSILASDESEDSISKGNKPIRTSRAPPTSSQGKFSSQNKYGSAETSSHTSLLDILKRSSIKSGFCNREDRLDLTQVISTFKIPK